MKNLWAPWRIEYILGEKEEGCVFCNRLGREMDEADLILHRGPRAFVIMNRYPYNNGHLLVMPNRHTWDFDSLDAEERSELFELLVRCRKVLEKAMSPEGYNIGLNLGKTAGAGIEEHVHFHVVPRWNGDVNFMTPLAEVRCIPEHLLATYRKLRPHFDRPDTLGDES